MNRRSFLSRMAGRSLAASALVGASGQRPAATTTAPLHKLQQQFRQLKQSLDDMDRSQRRLTRGLMVVAGVSLGLDLTLLL